MEPELRDNPLLSISHPIAFDRVRAEHVVPAISTLLAAARQELEALESSQGPYTYDSSLGRLEALTEGVERAMGIVGHLESVATTPELRAAYNQVQPEVSAFFSSISVSEGAYRAVTEFSQAAGATLDPVRARFLQKTIDSFRREGAELDADGKAKLSVLDVELSEKTTKFAQNVLDSTNAFELVIEDAARLKGLPERALQAARQNAESKGKSGYRFTLQAPSLLPVLTHVADPQIRETMYRAFNARASQGSYDNAPIVRRILELRQAKAELLGFDNFVDLVLADRMARSGQTARDFVSGLRDKTQGAFADENAQLERFRKQSGDGDPAAGLRPWDINYYAEQQRRALYDFDEEALRPYFPLERVLSGLFDLVQRLYGIHVEAAEGLPAWHPTVRTYRIVDGDGAELGVFYADLFPREEKRDGAWMNAFLTGLPQSQGQWTPHVGLICANLTPPMGDRPALLSHREVETVFHEFGHLLHHMLSRVPVRSLAGTSVAWDFVELPSQIMENFCWERATLDLFARHHETGEVIPDALFERMSRARTYRAANLMMRQLGFASLDLALHIACPLLQVPDEAGSVAGFAREVMAPFSPVEQEKDYAMVLGFGHLFAHPVGYAGGYYSYKWAEVLDADAFSRFRDEGLFSAELGREFRDKILSRGDSRDPMELFIDFMGREPKQQALLERNGIQA